MPRVRLFSSCHTVVYHRDERLLMAAGQLGVPWDNSFYSSIMIGLQHSYSLPDALWLTEEVASPCELDAHVFLMSCYLICIPIYWLCLFSTFSLLVLHYSHFQVLHHEIKANTETGFIFVFLFHPFAFFFIYIFSTLKQHSVLVAIFLILESDLHSYDYLKTRTHARAHTHTHTHTVN
jgi:hypothetical protein